jgi:VWFA-related protein
VKALAIVAALGAFAAYVVALSGQQVFRSGVQTVLVDVSVMRGRTPRANLTATDFSLTDNGALQRIESLSATAIPLDVSLVVDATRFTQGLASGMGPAGTDELHRNAQKLADWLQPEDRLRVITFAGDVIETRPMSSIGTKPAPISLKNPTTNESSRRYRMTQAVLTALTTPVSADRRHIVIVFAMGRGEAEAAPLEHLVPPAKRADALLYAVLTPPLQDVRSHQPIAFYPYEVVNRDALTKAAEATGGKAFLTGDIVGAFRDVVKEFRRSYVLRYTLQGVPSAGWHDIVVKVPSCPTCTIRARRGYMGR